MKICFIGIGSIACRHIKNMHLICEINKIPLTIDVVRSSNRELPQEIVQYIRDVYFNYYDMPNDYDVIFITNPTMLHIDTLDKVIDKADNFFVEKPVDSIANIKSIAFNKYETGKIIYVACPLRYTDVLRYLKSNIDVSLVRSVRVISSSYLPDWRPDVDYRKTYSAHKHLGGGVSIDLIHEWDYIKFIFGKPLSIKSIISKKSLLEIDSDDIAVYIAEYPSMLLELHLDYFGKNSVRQLEIITDEDRIIADLIKSSIIYTGSGKVIDFNESRDQYQIKELEYFLKIIIGKADNTNDLAIACDTLLLSQGDIGGCMQ